VLKSSFVNLKWSYLYVILTLVLYGNKDMREMYGFSVC